MSVLVLQLRQLTRKLLMLLQRYWQTNDHSSQSLWNVDVFRASCGRLSFASYHGTLVRITHDHSYVGELIDSGQITADEARTPLLSLSVAALGSDPDMYADHFSLGSI